METLTKRHKKLMELLVRLAGNSALVDQAFEVVKNEKGAEASLRDVVDYILVVKKGSPAEKQDELEVAAVG